MTPARPASRSPRPRWTGPLYVIHLWVGIVVALQMLLWTASGLLMSSNAIETVRGEHLRRTVAPANLRSVGPIVPVSALLATPAETVELGMLLGRPVYRLKAGKAKWLVDARTGQRWTLDAADAVAVARAAITLADVPTASPVTDPPPLELRRPGGAWRVTYQDGTNVYIGPAGEILAVRTGLWRWHDFAWGLHILDPGGREDTHNSLLIGSAALALVSVLSGIVLIFVHFQRRLS